MRSKNKKKSYKNGKNDSSKFGALLSFIESHDQEPSSQKNNKKSHLQNLEAKVKRQKNELTKLRTQVVELEGQLRQSSEDGQRDPNLKANNNQALIKIDALEKDCANYTLRLERATESIKQLTEDNQQLTIEKSTYKANWDDKNKKYQVSRAKVKSLEAERLGAGKTIADLASRLEQLQTSDQEKEQTIQLLNHKLEMQECLTEKLNAADASLKKYSNTLVNSNQTLLQQNQQEAINRLVAEKKLSVAEIKNHKLEAELNAIKKQLLIKEGAIIRLQNENNFLKDLRSNAAADISNLTRHHKDFLRRYIGYRKNKSFVEGLFSESVVRIAEIKSDMESMRDIYQKLLNQLLCDDANEFTSVDKLEIFICYSVCSLYTKQQYWNYAYVNFLQQLSVELFSNTDALNDSMLGEGKPYFAESLLHLFASQINYAAEKGLGVYGGHGGQIFMQDIKERAKAIYFYMTTNHHDQGHDLIQSCHHSAFLIYYSLFNANRANKADYPMKECLKNMETILKSISDTFSEFVQPQYQQCLQAYEELFPSSKSSLASSPDGFLSGRSSSGSSSRDSSRKNSSPLFDKTWF